MRPPVQVIPQPPQLVASRCWSTHTPLQPARPTAQQVTSTFVTSALATMPTALDTVQIWSGGCVDTATEYAAPVGCSTEKAYGPLVKSVSGSVPLFVSETLPTRPETVPPMEFPLTQMPATHNGVAPRHAMGHEPQWSRLVWVLTHSTPHAVVPPLQMSWHVPPLQVCPNGHAIPAFAPAQSPPAPQNWLLLAGSTHVPSQLTRPAWHESVHVEAAHTRPAVHDCPALPATQSPVAPQ
jgi:hypothetical protein